MPTLQQDDETYDSFDALRSGKPPIKVPRPTSPRSNNPFSLEQPLALQQHQENLSAESQREPGLMRGLGEMMVAPFGGYTPGLQKSNVRDLPVMKDYPVEEPSRALPFLKGAYKTGVEPLLDIGKTAYEDLTTSPWSEKGYKTFQKAIVDPMQHTFDTGMREDISPVEAAGHRALSILPVVGPFVSDVLSNAGPRTVFGATPEERSEAVGEVAGPVAAGKAIHSAIKGGARGYRNLGQKRLSTAEAQIAVAADIPEETVTAALPYFDKFLKETKGVDYRGRPLASSVVKSRARGIESMDMDSLAETARHAENDFLEKNIKPVQTQLNSLPVDAKPIAHSAFQSLDPVFKETLKDTPAPPQLRAVERLLMKAKNMKDLFAIRKSLNGITKTMQAESRLSKADFVRSDPRGAYLDHVTKQVRDMIDRNIDVNAGQIGQTAEVLKTYSHLKDFADGLEAGAERAKGLETKARGTREHLLRPITRGVTGALGWRSPALATEAGARLIESKANLPSNLVSSAGSLIERRGSLGLTPSGRSAMFQPPDINWTAPIGPFGPNVHQGPILGGPNAFQQPPVVNVPPTLNVPPVSPNQPFTGPQTFVPPSQIPRGTPPPQAQLPAVSPVVTPPPQFRLPAGQIPRQLSPGVYEAGEGELGDVIRQEAVRQPEGISGPRDIPPEELKVSEQRAVQPQEGELDLSQFGPLEVIDKRLEARGLKISDKRAEFEQPTKFSTAPERMQGTPSRREMISGLSERTRLTPEQAAEQQQQRGLDRLAQGKPLSIVPRRPSRPKAEAKSVETTETRQPTTKPPKEAKWEMKSAGEGKVELYKNGVKMFDEPLPEKAAKDWVQKRQSEEKGVRKFYEEGEKGAAKLTPEQEKKFPTTITLPDGHEAIRREVHDFGMPGHQYMAYDVTKSHDPNYVNSTIYFKLDTNDVVKDFQAKIDQHPSLKKK